MNVSVGGGRPSLGVPMCQRHGQGLGKARWNSFESWDVDALGSSHDGYRAQLGTWTAAAAVVRHGWCLVGGMETSSQPAQSNRHPEECRAPISQLWVYLECCRRRPRPHCCHPPGRGCTPRHRGRAPGSAWPRTRCSAPGSRQLGRREVPAVRPLHQASPAREQEQVASTKPGLVGDSPCP